jgi:hypothetical protein
MMTTADSLLDLEVARGLLRAANGDLGVAVARLHRRLVELEEKVEALSERIESKRR